MSDPSRFTVALIGFSDFESAALGSCFRLAASRTPTYVQLNSPDHSDFLIADADQAHAVDAVIARGRAADTVFVGGQAPAETMARLSRPIDPRHIVRELDALVALRVTSPPMRPQLAEAVPTVASGVLPVTVREVSRGGGGGGRDVLVVEDSAIAAKFLTQRLLRFGYRVHLASHGEAAIELVSQRPFALAFIDVVLGPPGSIDGLRVCQTIKRRTLPSRAAGTAVVMVTGLGGASDRVRGSLAGCDAYLVKPLLEADFIKAVRSLDPAFDWTEQTGTGTAIAS